ncbi:hypothetical protein [Mycobacteroides abscessus]|uniref:hypothetical protein n=1 Tax=Mycobacteroides abscessus TaxID=36809 RepID=UPI001877BF59|nr:hypothetical protein [Mycobacteroides abscessus]
MTTAEKVREDARTGPKVTVVTISGDRQHGKTHVLLDIVAAEIRRGRFVVYEVPDPPLATECLRCLTDDHLLWGIDELERVCRSFADMSIRHRSGGRIKFVTRGSARSGKLRGDTYVFDGTPVPRELLYGPPARIYHAPLSDDRLFW